MTRVQKARAERLGYSTTPITITFVIQNTNGETLSKPMASYWLAFNTARVVVAALKETLLVVSSDGQQCYHVDFENN